MFRTRYISGSQERLDCEGWGVSQWNSTCLSISNKTTTTKAELCPWGDFKLLNDPMIVNMDMHLV